MLIDKELIIEAFINSPVTRGDLPNSREIFESHVEEHFAKNKNAIEKWEEKLSRERNIGKLEELRIKKEAILSYPSGNNTNISIPKTPKRKI